MATYSSIRRANPQMAGMEICEITPVILGGDPIAPDNKTVVTRQQHFEIVRYWNRIIRDLREQARKQ